MPEERVFLDRSHQPTDDDLAGALGRVKTHWDNLTTYAMKENPDAKPEWKCYTKKSGWTYVLRGKRRNVFYLTPLNKCFWVGFLFAEKTVDAAEQSDLPEPVLEMIRQAPKYPEGRGIRLTVSKAADVKTAKKLLKLRMKH